MIPNAIVRFVQTVEPPEPGKEIYWIAGLLAGGIAFMWWQIREADKARHLEKDATIKRAHDREDLLLKVDIERTDTMKQLTAQVEVAAKMTATVVEGSLSLKTIMDTMGKGVESNAKSIDQCNKTMDGMTLEFRNLALRLQEHTKTKTDQGP